MTDHNKRFAKFICLLFAAIVAISLISSGGSKITAAAQPTTKADRLVPTSPESDLRTGDISIKNGISGECAKQIMQHRATAACELEGQRWNDELHMKLSNPQWRAQFERKLNAIIQ